ncbi:pyruvate kinase [Microbulbifer donghaiensis]|uniref:Pyruvate kinase n=1 Tax=Microbulbifer donghaiensis TaxID=494016 RepID=A0A1M4Y753_9GAMM|nr:pyruvate kinase [Microbulbifer donghaiensis]SHF01413.1 pyruvate kinase [Microbulbifer donghaiensis]
MIRHTKIVATLGPGTDKPHVIEEMIRAGVNIVRLNFSHGSAEDHRRRVDEVRRAAVAQNKLVAVLGDLQGPKIRIARFNEGSVWLDNNAEFALDLDCPPEGGNQHRVGVDYPSLISDCKAGNILLLDDGKIRLEVTGATPRKLYCRVLQGGKLSNNKGINLLGGGLSAPALTEKDYRDIELAAQLEVDFLAVSFPRCAEDLETARSAMQEAGSQAAIVAKVERAEAVADDEQMDNLILAADAIMVARGDLGVEIGDPALVGVQKKLINRANALNRGVITATQMMESMITSPTPTRAEVMDVANAVLDGTDAVMLSAETAAGDYPVAAVESMSEVIVGAEQYLGSVPRPAANQSASGRIDTVIAQAAIDVAARVENLCAIAALTESGRTPRMMSRATTQLPIYALTRHPRVARQLVLLRGVEPVEFDPAPVPLGHLTEAIIEVLGSRLELQKGQRILITQGERLNVGGHTSSMRIKEIE